MYITCTIPFTSQAYVATVENCYCCSILLVVRTQKIKCNPLLLARYRQKCVENKIFTKGRQTCEEGKTMNLMNTCLCASLLPSYHSTSCLGTHLTYPVKQLQCCIFTRRTHQTPNYCHSLNLNLLGFVITQTLQTTRKNNQFCLSKHHTKKSLLIM